MTDYLKNLGLTIRNIRKIRGLTLENLATKINKSKATVSKYENGEISIDILTINEIAKALNISVEELLPQNKEIVLKEIPKIDNSRPNFFKNNSVIYSYYYDGRNTSIITSAINITKYNEDGSGNVYMYMNIKDLDYPQGCEMVYYGKIYHYDIITKIYLENRDTPIEKATIAILSTFQETSERWGLWSGISIRPIMPASLKMLFTKRPQVIDSKLKEKLIISKEDYKNMKHFNMFSVF